MDIQLWMISKTTMPFVKEGVEVFTKRIKRYYPFKLVVFPAVKSKSAKQSKKLEAENILAKVPTHSCLVLLDEKGKSMDSIAFANCVQTYLNQSKKHLIFVVGGAYGFDDSIKQKANQLISLSDMTFSHQLIRLIFCEQLYRACTILRGEKYHNI